MSFPTTLNVKLAKSGDDLTLAFPKGCQMHDGAAEIASGGSVTFILTGGSTATEFSIADSPDTVTFSPASPISGPGPWTVTPKNSSTTDPTTISFTVKLKIDGSWISTDPEMYVGEGG